MTESPKSDPSNGYDAIADLYQETRSNTGRALVKAWANALPPGAEILDLGAGPGEPITSVLIEAGACVSAIDASSAMVKLFRERFPDILIACEPVESSTFFDRKFDAILCVGLIFLLSAPAQIALLKRVSGALTPTGRFLFSAPVETGTWKDLMTDQLSQSLGQDAYIKALKDAGFRRIESQHDEGGAHYYDARKSFA